MGERGEQRIEGREEESERASERETIKSKKRKIHVKNKTTTTKSI